MNGNSESGDYFLKFRDEKLFNNQKSVEECFRYFDRNQFVENSLILLDQIEI